MKKVTIVACSHEFPLEIADREPVVEIKRKIEKLLGVPVPAQTLSIFGWDLIDDLDMDDYPIITHGTKIDLAIKPMLPNKKIPITIKLSSRHVTTVEVDTSDTVKSLKEKILHVSSGGATATAAATNPTRMSLFFSGVELEDEFRNLSEYGVHEFAEIVVFVKPMGRPKGGVDHHQGQTTTSGGGGRVLGLVVQTASCLMNGASIAVEMEDSRTVSDLREVLVSGKNGGGGLPRDDYIFIHRQRIMRENCSLRWHGVQNGEVIYVFKGTVSRGGH